MKNKKYWSLGCLIAMAVVVVVILVVPSIAVRFAPIKIYTGELDSTYFSANEGFVFEFADNTVFTLKEYQQVNSWEPFKYWEAPLPQDGYDKFFKRFPDFHWGNPKGEVVNGTWTRIPVYLKIEYQKYDSYLHLVDIKNIGGE